MAIIGGLAITAGAAAYSAYNANKASSAQTDVAQQQSDLARQLLGEGAGPRQLSSAYLQHFLSRGDIPGGLNTGPPAQNYGLEHFLQTGTLPPSVDLAPTTAANRDILETQFGRARENIMSRTPQGGQMNAALTNLEGQRALGATQIYTDANAQRNKLAQSLYGTGIDLSREATLQDQNLRRQLFASALGLGTSSSAAALQGLSGASQGFGNVASNALKSTAMDSDLALTLGSYGLRANALQNQNTKNVQSDINTMFQNPNIY